MKELYVGRQEERDEIGQLHRFDYYILVDQMDIEGAFACESYGIKITALEKSESIQIPHITTDIKRIGDLASCLLRNTVTPSTLKDVVLDWL
ncbi:hypothetical protein D1159_03420 [Pseudoflavonifractor sp. 524-17]|uniref:DUF6514 family protein n=1 Tax=Pseudoflavonifractor sp. 524-17 TaxID=2304577 RepID=UPI001379F5E4|nr:DUF6514 family protein [Pseudoflavonifractor sp. 524-17]NCE63652.1 hypothetical protein [Pseudoflavonifractor sp. 524-17]